LRIHLRSGAQLSGVTLAVTDAGGNTLLSQTTDFAVGQSSFLDWNGNTLARRFGQRNEVQPVLTFTLPACPTTPCTIPAGSAPFLVASVEVIDQSSARSSFVSQPYPLPLWPPDPVGGFPPSPTGSYPPDPTGSMVGVARGQALRVSVAATLGPCTAQLQVADASGNILASAPGVALAQGQSTSLNFVPIVYPPDPAGSRVSVLPLVQLSNRTGAPASGCVATTEIYDRFLGFDSALVKAGIDPGPCQCGVNPGPVQCGVNPGPAQCGINPGPVSVDPGPISFGLMGVGMFQTVRLNLQGISTDPANPCVAQLGFNDANGNPLVATPQVFTLNAGQTASIDLNGNTLVSTLGPQAPVVPVVFPPDPTGSRCSASAETYEQIFNSTGVPGGALKQGELTPKLKEIPMTRNGLTDGRRSTFHNWASALVALAPLCMLIMHSPATAAQVKTSPAPLKAINPHPTQTKEGPPKGTIDGVVFWDTSKVKGPLGCSGFAIHVGEQAPKYKQADPRFVDTTPLNVVPNFVYSKLGTTILCNYTVANVPLDRSLQVTFTPPAGSFSPPITTMYSTNTGLFVIPPPPVAIARDTSPR